QSLRPLSRPITVPNNKPNPPSREIFELNNEYPFHLHTRNPVAMVFFLEIRDKETGRPYSSKDLVLVNINKEDIVQPITRFRFFGDNPADVDQHKPYYTLNRRSTYRLMYKGEEVWEHHQSFCVADLKK